ncbi:MAG: DUF1318 domain-containing protein [Proteobacteria bacterium]|nr:DUF1318 domain-containing protein [Pseudomonadota bacterium]
MIKRIKSLTFIGIALLSACVTVNIYFPAAAVQKAADEIVDEVRGTKDQQKPDKKPGSQSWFLNELRFSVGPKEVQAQTVNIIVSTPAIREMKHAIRERFHLVKPFYEQGNVGENKSGLIEIRNTDNLGLKDKADITRLVEQENNNRMMLYTEVMKANKLSAQSMPEIQKIFANSWRIKSQPNWWIQNDNGQWEKKK